MTLEIIPAVDILGGRVVRLLRGDAATAKVYYTNPLDAALRWVEEGAKSLHVVDLDAALGCGENLKQIEQIVEEINVEVQVGGGIRSLEKAERLINAGAARIVVGTRAVRERSFASELIERFGADKVVVALDYDRGVVLTEGWRKMGGVGVKEAVDSMRELGVEYILLTSKERDGTLEGPDCRAVREASRGGVKVLAAGGIGSVRHIVEVRDAGAYACILGRCLYEGAVKLREALEAAGGG